MRAQHNLGATLHALFWIFLSNWIALRFGFPDTLVRLGFAGGEPPSASVETCGAEPVDSGKVLTSMVTAAPVSSAVFGSPFLRVRVFLAGGGGGGASSLGTGATSTGEISATGTDDVPVACACGVSRGGSGGTGAMSSPPCNNRHTCSRLTSVWFSRCSPS